MSTEILMSYKLDFHPMSIANLVFWRQRDKCKSHTSYHYTPACMFAKLVHFYFIRISQ